MIHFLWLYKPSTTPVLTEDPQNQDMLMEQLSCLVCEIFRKESVSINHKFLNCMCTVDNHFTAKKYKATLEHGLEETTWKKPFLHKFICLAAWCHTFNMRKWTNYLIFAYKLLIFGGWGMTPYVILGQFLNFSKSLVPYLQSRLILVMQDGVRFN